MSALVVQHHPRDDSYNAALLAQVAAQLPHAKILRIGHGDQLTADACRDVNRLVVVYPTWWGSMPSALLSQLVELILPWVDGAQPASTSPFRSIQKLTIVTSHGSSQLINRLQGEPGRQLWRRVVLPLCAPNARMDWQALYKLDRATSQDRTRFLASVCSR